MSIICKPFVFVRHGETSLNRDKLIGGCTDVVLTEDGELQALQAGQLLSQYSWSCVAVSPLLRARQTAILALPTVSYQVFDDLRERDWGDLELQPWTKLLPYEATPPDGESWPAFCQRVIEVLNTILSEHERPLIVAHSGIFRVLLQLAQGSPYGNRVGNVVPMWVSPGQKANEWRIQPLEETTVDIG